MEKIKQKGITLVETIVSMALFIIVSASVFLTCNYSIKVQAQNEIKHFFVVETENIAMCYYSDSFDDALAFLMAENVNFVEKDTQNNIYTIYYSKELTYAESENATYKLIFEFSDESSPVVICEHINNGKQIYKYGGENE